MSRSVDMLEDGTIRLLVGSVEESGDISCQNGRNLKLMSYFWPEVNHRQLNYRKQNHRIQSLTICRFLETKWSWKQLPILHRET